VRRPHGLAVAVRGLRSRTVLTLGTILLAVIGVASAVVGPAYLRAATNSLLIDRLEAAPTSEAGLTWEYDPALTAAASGSEVIAHAKTAAAARAPAEFGPPQVSLVSRRFEVTLPRFDSPAKFGLRALERGCADLIVSGRCPVRPFEVLVARVDVQRGGLEVGHQIPLPARSRAAAVVVGTYRLDPAADWFDTSRFDSVPVLPGAEPGSPDVRPYQPAPLITPAGTFDALPAGQWWADVDRPLLIEPTFTPATADRLATIAQGERDRRPIRDAGGTLHPAQWNGLRGIVDDVEAERQTARDTVLPAALSLSLVALLLLFRLLGESTDLRRPEFALLSLRGWSRRRLWVFGLTEPVVVLAIAVPVGILAGWQATMWLAAAWLHPDLPVTLPTGSILGAAGMLVAGMAAVSFALVHVMREQLREQLLATSRPRAIGRLELVAQAAIVVAAGTGAYAVATRDGRGSPGLLDLLLPVLLALAAGLLAGHLTVLLARQLIRRTRRRPSLTSFLSARRLGRRREATLVVLPLAVALGVGVFAVGVQLAAANWRDSVAASRVGADLAYVSDLTPVQTMALTRRLDPDGEWLMAGAVILNLDGPQIVALDTTRMGTVGVWPSGWGVESGPAGVADRLAPERELPRFEGRDVILDVGNDVRSRGALQLLVQVRDPTGEVIDVTTGDVPLGDSRVRVATPCERGCELIGIGLGGPAGSSAQMRGELVIREFSVGGQPLAAGLDEPDTWRPIRPYTGDDDESIVAVDTGTAGLRMHVDTDGYDFALITPTDVPDVRPVLATSDVTLAPAPDVADAGLLLGPGETDPLEADIPVRLVGTTEAVPLLGRSGLLIDLTSYTRETYEGGPGTTSTYVLARAGVPGDLLRDLAAAGVQVDEPMSRAAEERALANDAYALSLRLYVVVAVALLVLALAGVVAHLVVEMPGRRHDAAALRVVGVSKRKVARSSVVELGVTLGVAALSGVVAGVVAQRIVLGQIRLGTADARSPDVPADMDLSMLGGYLAVTAIGLLLVAATVARASVRRARGAELRESAR
jgi:putative ABC transport system permease protein